MKTCNEGTKVSLPSEWSKSSFNDRQIGSGMSILSLSLSLSLSALTMDVCFSNTIGKSAACFNGYDISLYLILCEWVHR